MVLQDTWVFHGTIFENIAYGKADATMEEVVAAAKAARIHPFIMRLPLGYDTVISEDGGNISKGQKQLLTIARAMLYDAPMLILDEATSNVDTATEREIQKAMRELMKQKTCFVIAHRLSTIENADLILVLRDGDVVEQGTHRELMDKKASTISSMPPSLNKNISFFVCHWGRFQMTHGYTKKEVPAGTKCASRNRPQ